MVICSPRARPSRAPAPGAAAAPARPHGPDPSFPERLCPSAAAPQGMFPCTWSALGYKYSVFSLRAGLSPGSSAGARAVLLPR